MRNAFRVFCFSFCLLPSAFVTEAQADIVVFKNGRTMSVKACRVDGDMATLRLREGGEVTFPAAIVARVEPDRAEGRGRGSGLARLDLYDGGLLAAPP